MLGHYHYHIVCSQPKNLENFAHSGKNLNLFGGAYSRVFKKYCNSIRKNIAISIATLFPPSVATAKCKFANIVNIPAKKHKNR